MERANPARTQAIRTAKVALFDKLGLLFESQMAPHDIELYRFLCKDPDVIERRPGAVSIGRKAALDQLELKLD